MVKIEIAYIGEHQQIILPFEVTKDSTIFDALQASTILEKFPEIDLALNKVGIWGKLCSLESKLTDGDRVEIYRPLPVDPKLARRIRAKHQPLGKNGNFQSPR